MPRVDFYLGAEDPDKAVVLRMRYVEIVYVGSPLGNALEAVWAGVGAEVGDHAAGYKYVARK